MKSLPSSLSRTVLTVVMTLTLAAAAGVMVVRGPAHAQELRAGAAVADITPPLGIPVIGNFGEMLALNVHDPLLVRAVVVDDGKRKVAMAVCDLLGFRGLVSEEARRRIGEITGIPKEHVLVTATHTHSGGDALGNPHARQENLTDYQKFVAHRVADAVSMADRRLRPAEAAFGKVDIPEHVFNRRWAMREGTMPPNPFGRTDKARMNPPVGNPDLLEPVGPTDPALSFVAFREPGGRLISLFAAYSLHYIGGVAYGDVSADYFGVFCAELQKLQPAPPDPAAPAFVAMLANGTSGDINNINFRGGGPAYGPYEKMKIVGRDVAERTHRALAAVEWRKGLTVDARYQVLPLRRLPMETELLDWAETTARKELPAGAVDLPKIYAERVLSIRAADQAMPAPVHYLRIGDIGIGALPGEVFAETGLEFRKRAPLPQSFLVSMAHDYLGYLPPPRQQALGGYETWPGTNYLEPKAAGDMLEAVLDMAASARP